MRDDYFIGYTARIPARYRKSVRRLVGMSLLAALALAAAFASGQHFPESHFAFGDFQRHEGVIELSPIPHYVDVVGGVRYPLVAPGKFGADAMLLPFDHRKVEFRAQRFERQGIAMFEVDPKSLLPVGDSAENVGWRPQNVRAFEGVGEIVGSKCYLGVMNPGEGPTHAACARHCIRGGVPAMLRVRLPEGREAAYFLAGVDRASLVALAGQRVFARGRLSDSGSLPILQVAALSGAPSSPISSRVE